MQKQKGEGCRARQPLVQSRITEHRGQEHVIAAAAATAEQPAFSS